MEMNWTTFALEIVNFLILVWLLVRFLYRPVMDLIEQRRLVIRKQLEAAEATRREAEALQQTYTVRINAWDDEKTAARKQLQEALAAEREQLLAELRRELEQEREKAGILNQRQLTDEKRLLARQALQRGAAFCAKLLARLARPELEAMLIDLAIEDLEQLTPEQREQLKKNHGRNRNAISITSAYPLPAETSARLERKLVALFGTGSTYTYQVEPELIAGLNIRIGAWLLQANLHDELRAYAELDQD